MKFSMIAAGERLTIPAHGEGGRTIVKLPSKDYPDLPEIEYGAMRLAEAVGVQAEVVAQEDLRRDPDIGAELLGVVAELRRV